MSMSAFRVAAVAVRTVAAKPCVFVSRMSTSMSNVAHAPVWLLGFGVSSCSCFITECFWCMVPFFGEQPVPRKTPQEYIAAVAPIEVEHTIAVCNGGVLFL